MKLTRLLLMVGLLASPACERVRQLAAGLGKKAPPATSAAVVSGPLVSEISAEAFDTFSQQRGKLAIVDFHADWCGPCRRLAPLLEKITAEYGGVVVVGEINVDHFRELASKEGVNGIPDVRIYRDGSLVDKFVGLPGEGQLRALIAKHAKGLPPPTAPTAPAKDAVPTKSVTEPMRKDWMPAGMKRR